MSYTRSWLRNVQLVPLTEPESIAPENNSFRYFVTSPTDSRSVSNINSVASSSSKQSLDDMPACSTTPLIILYGQSPSILILYRKLNVSCGRGDSKSPDS